MDLKDARKVLIVGFPKDRADELDDWLRQSRGAYVHKHWPSGCNYSNKDVPTSVHVAIVSKAHGRHPNDVVKRLKKAGIPYVLARFGKNEGTWVRLLTRHLPETDDPVGGAKVEPEPEEQEQEELDEGSIWYQRLVDHDKSEQILVCRIKEGDAIIRGKMGEPFFVTALAGDETTVEMLLMSPEDKEDALTLPADIYVKAVPCAHEPDWEVDWNGEHMQTTCRYCGADGKASMPKITWEEAA